MSGDDIAFVLRAGARGDGSPLPAAVVSTVTGPRACATAVMPYSRER